MLSKKLLLFFCGCLFVSACQNASTETATDATYETFLHKKYKLLLPSAQAKAVLILFGGFPQNSEDIQREFYITDLAKENQIAVGFMNYSRKIWLEDADKKELTQILNDLFKNHQLPVDNVYIGGFLTSRTVWFYFTISVKSSVG